MNESKAMAGILELLGGRLCLDFANTVDWHASNRPVEYLSDYGDLLSWSVHVGALTDSLKQRLREKAARHPIEAEAAWEQAIRLREALYRIFSALSHRLTPEAADLSMLNDELSRALSKACLVLTEDGFVWGWADNGDPLDRMLWPVIQDAANLLTSEDLSRVGQCADDRCGWLFIDNSRNHSRRWCSMEYCGNRAKARRHYERSQKT